MVLIDVSTDTVVVINSHLTCFVTAPGRGAESMIMKFISHLDIPHRRTATSTKTNKQRIFLALAQKFISPTFKSYTLSLRK